VSYRFVRLAVPGHLPLYLCLPENQGQSEYVLRIAVPGLLTQRMAEKIVEKVLLAPDEEAVVAGIGMGSNKDEWTVLGFCREGSYLQLRVLEHVIRPRVTVAHQSLPTWAVDGLYEFTSYYGLSETPLITELRTTVEQTLEISGYALPTGAGSPGELIRVLCVVTSVWKLPALSTARRDYLLTDMLEDLESRAADDVLAKYCLGQILACRGAEMRRLRVRTYSKVVEYFATSYLANSMSGAKVYGHAEVKERGLIALRALRVPQLRGSAVSCAGLLSDQLGAEVVYDKLDGVLLVRAYKDAKLAGYLFFRLPSQNEAGLVIALATILVLTRLQEAKR
jgi:hypothetical protein